ncbi:hypothetical protein M5G27_09260 [Pseudomonas shahriarae]|uniref:Uncharacterized protein n=1 Tax=Pseudomonas shahriarae TaxID=2745512 RepID=A0A9X4BZU1_9PSED|nr:hypothetical protein [Pseudomonas shahriarae]MDD1007663.1 hypothetical protein [Pseudomonas shahriarae]
MDETELQPQPQPQPQRDRREQALIRCLIDELTAVPVASPDAPLRTLEIPRECLLHEWTELYWSALERPEFLDWASRFHIDLDTLNLKDDTLQVLTAPNGTRTLRTFTLEDDSGWWQMAPILWSISQRIDTAGFGLPYVGGKSANPLHRFPRRVVLAFYGYPEPQNVQQARALINELKHSGLARINADDHTTSALVVERSTQLQDLRDIATTLEQALAEDEQLKRPFDLASIAGLPITLTSGSQLSNAALALDLDHVLSRYGYPLPQNSQQARTLVSRLRQQTWPPLPYVSEYVQTALPILRYQQAFGDVENCQHIIRRLEALSRNKDATAPIDLTEQSQPMPVSSLGHRVAADKVTLAAFRANAAFQAILRRENLRANSPLLVSERGHVGTPGRNDSWVNLTAKVKKNRELNAMLERLKSLAAEAGGAMRSNGKVSLRQMMRFYEMNLPDNVESARRIAQWEKTLLALHPSYMDHWYLLGHPGKNAERFTVEQRQLIIDTTQAFVPPDSAPLIDYLSEGVDTDLPRATLLAKADYRISQILITPRSHALGNQLLSAFKQAYKEKALIAVNRERLIMAALILSLDANIGEQLDRVVGQPLNDRFFWGESLSEVRRFIEHQSGLAAITNKTLATHLLLSGIAPEFLIRGIPDSVTYISSIDWVKLKQTVLHVEHLKSGLSRLMSFDQLMTLASIPIALTAQTYESKYASAALVADWAIARGLIQRDPELAGNTYDAATLGQAAARFSAHTQALDRLRQEAFDSGFATPYTVALADLQAVFGHHLHLEDRVLVASDASANAHNQAPFYSLVELHMADRLKPDMTHWRSTLAALNLQTMAPQFSRLRKVSGQFQSALASRLTRLKNAYVALIKEAFCELPLQQRLDIEDGTLQLFALHPVAEPQQPAGAGSFAIIALLEGFNSRIFEIFVRHSQVRLRRDIPPSLLMSAAQRELPFDDEAYRRGTRPREQAICQGIIERLDVPGAPFTRQSAAIPDTYDSPAINAIAQAAVDHMFKEREASTLERAGATLDLKDAETCHAAWLAFYQSLSP